MKVIKITKKSTWHEDGYTVYYAGRGDDNIALYSFWRDGLEYASDLTNESTDIINELLERTKLAYKTEKVELVEIN